MPWGCPLRGALTTENRSVHFRPAAGFPEPVCEAGGICNATMAVSETASTVLAHSEWVRRLAHSLVEDPHLADDLAQATCIAAWRRPPASDENVRGWLSRVLRNFAHQSRRSERRRRARESVAARPEAQRSTAEVVERASSHRAVVQAALELSEPYRTAILLRYLEGRTPAQIAQQLGVPKETVRTRLVRGLARLRARLDREHGGDRRAWIAALATLTTPDRWVPIACATLMLKAKNVIIATVVVLAGLAVGWGFLAAEPNPAADRPGDAAGVAQAAAPTDDAAPATDASAEAQRRALAEPTPTPAADAPPMFRGRVLDVAGNPAAGVPVRFDGDAESETETDHRALTDTGGWFQLAVPSAARRIVADRDGLITVLLGVIAPNSEAARIEPVVVVAQRLEVGILVHDAANSPLPGATVSYRIPDGFRTRFSQVLDFSQTPRWQARTDMRGRLAGFALPRIPGATLDVRKLGFSPTTIAAPERSRDDLRVELRRPAGGADTLDGLVVDASGQPASGAHVSLGFAETVSGDDGRFRLDLASARGARRLVAAKVGHLPALLDLPDDEKVPTVRLELGSAPLQIAGIVTDADGKPLAGVRVWPKSPTVFGRVDGRFASVEGFLAQREQASWNVVDTGEDGSFTLDGMLERDYELVAMVPDDLILVDAGPFAAGSRNVQIVIPDRAAYPVVKGRVVSRFNTPVPGVSVAAVCDANRLAFETGGASTQHAGGRRVLTDKDGRFELRGVGRNRVYLETRGASIVQKSFGRGLDGGFLEAVTGPETDLRLVVNLRVHIRVELADPTEADQLSVLDADNERVILHRIQGGSTRSNFEFPLTDGRSDTLATSDAVQTLVLRKDGEVVRRVPITPTPGDVYVVR